MQLQNQKQTTKADTLVFVSWIQQTLLLETLDKEEGIETYGNGIS